MGAKEQMIAILRGRDTARIRFEYRSDGKNATINHDCFTRVADDLQSGHLSVVEGRHRVNMVTYSSCGQTALMNAAFEDDIEIVKLLLNAGANVNMKNEDGETAMDQASDEEVESLLVSFGAIPKSEPAKTTDGDSSDN